MSPKIRTILSLVLVAVFLVGCGGSDTANLTENNPVPTTKTEPTPAKLAAEDSGKSEAPVADCNKSEASAADCGKAEAPAADSSKEGAPASGEKPENYSWIKTYGGSQTDVVNDVLVAKDGGFYILGATNVDWEVWEGAEIYLVRTDSNGEVLWEKSYGGAPFQTGHAMTFTDDGNLMLASSIARDEDTRMDIYLLKVDLEGNELESHIIGGPMDEHVNAIQPTPDGGYILFGNIVDPDDFVTDPGVAGYGGFENRSSILVIRLDSAGNEIWTSVLDNGKNTMGIGGGAIKGGGYYVVSSILNYPELDDDLHVIKLDEEGNEVWSRTWEEGRTNARGFQVTPEGNVLVGAMYSQSGDPREGDADYMLLEIDQEGTTLWEQVLGTPDIVDMITRVVQTKDGGYVVIIDRTEDLYYTDSELVLVKLDAKREIVWESVLDQKPHYMIRGLFQVEDGYLVATSFQNRAYDTFDIMLVKTDMKGNVAE
jgi:hypothetical protein